jgi:hypothetical protein
MFAGEGATCCVRAATLKIVKGAGSAATMFREIDMRFWLAKAEAELRGME